MGSRRLVVMPMAIILGITGCATVRTSPDADRNRSQTRETDSTGPRSDPQVRTAARDEVDDETQLPLALPVGEPGPGTPPELSASQPLDALLARALEVNPTVQAARFNVQALRHRIPQVTALEDPVLSNTIFPIPSVAPQYSLMGYMPYAVLLAQQFPWCGTLRLRGLAAEDDVRIALQEFVAAQLDVVAGVKRAYHDLHFNERALALLDQNRGLAEDFLKIARQRYRLATATQADVLRAEVAVSDIDRERETTRQAVGEARSELARLLQVSPETPLRTVSDLPVEAAPQQLDRLAQLACASRPELQGRLAAIARDRKAVELARKRYYPNLTVGLVYQDMQKTNAMTPATATGQPNVGFFVGMNLPVYHKKLAAGVHEAEARAAADAKLYEAERDQARRDIKDLFSQATVQQNVLSLLRRSNLPAAKRILDLTASDYRAGAAGVDYLSLIGAWRELLQVQLQVAQVEAELGKTLASLERAVGVQLNEHPPDPRATSHPPREEAQP